MTSLWQLLSASRSCPSVGKASDIIPKLLSCASDPISQSKPGAAFSCIPLLAPGRCGLVLLFITRQEADCMCIAMGIPAQPGTSGLKDIAFG